MTVLHTLTLSFSFSVQLSGPKSVQVLKKLTGSSSLEFMPFMSASNFKIDGVPIYVSRCGYTGEDGFEIQIPSKSVVEITQKLLFHESVQMAGLGSRDSLRLEAGLCLYGHDLDETVTPIQGSLSWTIGKKSSYSTAELV